ncbi:MAG: hypothetical protein F4Y49_16360 [Dehalococcoidia bacterium]|nr:hypothetical protein [Dehalococcoidia bacterium]
MNRAKPGIASAALAHFLAWAVSLYFAFYPCVYEGTTVTTQTGITISESGCSGSLVTVNGLRVLLVLAVPVAITGLGLFAMISNMVTYGVARILLWSSGISMALICLLGALSVGVLYIPAALAMIVAAIAGPLIAETDDQYA